MVKQETLHDHWQKGPPQRFMCMLGASSCPSVCLLSDEMSKELTGSMVFEPVHGYKL